MDYNMDSVQKELGNLRNQLEELLKHAQEKKDAVSSEMIDKLSRQVESLRHTAGAHMHQLYNAGQNGVAETEAFVRKNPLLSMGVAFVAGCVLSCLFRR